MNDQAQLLPGTLDLLILRAVSLGPLHGYGILLRIGQISGNALLIEQGALYPGLFRLVRQGLLKASWGTSENNRRAKFYELTAAGRKRLREETDSWNRLAAAIDFRARPATGGSMTWLGQRMIARAHSLISDRHFRRLTAFVSETQDCRCSVFVSAQSEARRRFISSGRLVVSGDAKATDD